MLAALLFAVSTVAIPPSPRLCLAAPDADLMSGTCSDAKEKEIAVEASEKTRDWLWVDAARHTIALGTLAPAATKIVVNDKPAALLSLSGSAERGWPAPTTIKLATAKDRWKFTLPREMATSFSALALSEGTYSLGIEAPRHIAYSMRTLQVAQQGKPAPIGKIELKPVPMLSGRFIDKSGKGVPDVAVNAPDGALIALSDPAGFVHEELRGTLPQRLFVRRTGFGHRNLEVTRNDADFDLGTVTLSPGSTLTINVDRNGYDGPLTASLIRPGEHTTGKRTTFETATVKRDASRIELTDVEARDYVLILHGEGPMQFIREDLSVGEHENATKDLRIDAHSVKAFVHKGRVPLAGTAVTLSAGNGEWTGTITTDDNGEFKTDAWLAEVVSISIEPKPRSRFHMSKQIGTTDAEWDIAVPDRRIHGIVVDKQSGDPAPVKFVSLRWRSPRASSATSVQVGDDGRFEIDMADAGQYIVTAYDPAYLDASVSFELKPEDGDRDVRLEMERGTKVRVKIVNADGLPVANAYVVGPRNMRDPPRLWASDPSGVAIVALRGNDPLQAWIVAPRDGFTIATIDPQANESANTVILPRSASTIAIRTANEDSSSAPHSHVFFSWNGNFAPSDVRDFLVNAPLLTGSDGRSVLTNMPAGEYDFWAWSSPEEHVGLENPAPLGAPTHASVLPGENSVTVIARVLGRPKPKQ